MFVVHSWIGTCINSYWRIACREHFNYTVLFYIYFKGLSQWAGGSARVWGIFGVAWDIWPLPREGWGGDWGPKQVTIYQKNRCKLQYSTPGVPTTPYLAFNDGQWFLDIPCHHYWWGVLALKTENYFGKNDGFPQMLNHQDQWFFTDSQSSLAMIFYT